MRPSFLRRWAGIEGVGDAGEAGGSGCEIESGKVAALSPILEPFPRCAGVSLCEVSFDGVESRNSLPSLLLVSDKDGLEVDEPGPIEFNSSSLAVLLLVSSFGLSRSEFYPKRGEVRRNQTKKKKKSGEGGCVKYR